MTNEHGIYDSPEYKKSRFAYKMECTFEYFVTLLVADAYLASLLSAIGMPDSMVGIVSSIASVAFCFQLLTMVFVQRINNVKRFSTIIHVIGRLFYVALYLIPFAGFIPEKYKGILAIGCIIMAYFGYYLVTSMIYKWGNSFVHPTKRASFSAAKEMLSLICGMVFTFTMGQLIDNKYTVYASDGTAQITNKGFILIAITIVVAIVLDTICLLIMKKEDDHHQIVEVEPVRKVVGNLFKNKSFVYLIILDCLHKAAMYSFAGFVGTFKLKELAMSVGTITLFTVISNGVRFLASKPIGWFSDKTSFATGITLGLAIKAAGYIFVIFITPDLWWMILGYQILYYVSTAATSQNLLNAVYSYVDKDHFVQATSIKNCLSGVLGFFVSLGAGALLSAIQNSETGMLEIFGVQLYAQQVLAIIAFLLTVVAFIFAQLVVRKRKVMVQ
ncbi:MAG: hypothetical protein IJW79_11230 [Clostridia bacterium]|nr:hypothetical protein [Clostridia bacterium]